MDKRQLADLRRKNPNGIWRIDMIVEGEDETFTGYYSGRLSETFVKRLAKHELARELKVSTKIIHVQGAEVEG